jgi:O-antigen ligase
MLGLLVPILFVSVGWFTHDPVNIFASSILLIFSLFLFSLEGRFKLSQNPVTYLPFVTVAIYVASSIVNGLSPASAFLGGYQRNYGVATFLALSIVFVLGIAKYQDQDKILKWIFPSTLFLAVVYGVLQWTKNDPLPWINPYAAVTLTLGNPNFSGAFFGLLTITTICLTLFSRNKISQLLALGCTATSFFLAQKTQSLQSILLIALSVIVFTFLISLNQKTKIFRTLKFLSSALFVGVFFLIAIIFAGNGNYLSGLREKFFFQGNVLQRLGYWQTGFDIWKDNPLFGVGPDQYQRYAAVYRTPQQLLRDGPFVIPDKAHNVLIDHFANGGVLAGLAWLAFIVLVFVSLFISLKKAENKIEYRNLAVLGSIWTTYVAQALISPDQLILSVIGYLTAGLIVGSHLKDVDTMKIDPFILRAIAGFALAISLIVMGKALSVNGQAKEVLQGRISGKDQIMKVIQSWPNYKTTELIGIQEIAKPNNCEFTNEIAKNLLKYDNRSSQAWFMRAICDNNNRDFVRALNDIEESLKYDPINTSYLAGKAKLEIAANDLGSAKQTVEKIQKLDPNNEEIPALLLSVNIGG